MATEDDKPQTTFTTEREKEEREFQTEVSGIPVNKLPPAEMKQVEPLHYDIEDACELKNGKLNTEPDLSNLNKDEAGGCSSLYSIEATTAHSEEVKDIGKGVHFEVGSIENKLNTPTASLEGDLHETIFATKEVKSSEISSTPLDTKLDSEILHSSATDETIDKEDSSDLSQSISTQIACQNDHIEETKGNGQVAEIQPASHVINSSMTNASSGTAGSINKNYEVQSTDDSTDNSSEDVGISSPSQYPNKEDDKKEKENGDSNKEQLSVPLSAESTEETISKNMDSDKVEQLEGNSGTKNEGNQGTSKVSLDRKEITDNELDILGTDRLESSVSETQNYSCDKPESIREVLDMASMSKESQPKKREVSDIVLMIEKERQPKEIHEDDPEEVMQRKEEVSSEEHNFTSQGSHHMENKSGEELQVKNIVSTCPKEEADYMNDQEIRGSTSNDFEENQSNRRMDENSYLQEFQMIAKSNKVLDEADNPELLPIKDLGTVTSDEVPEAVITEAAKDVIWEQKEVPITKESKETKKRNDELADATNLLSQSSEENSNNYQAIEGADDCTDNTNISRMPEEEKRLEEVHVDDKSLATSDIESQEKPPENNRSITGLSSEEVRDVKLGNVLDLALQCQTTESENANEDSIRIGSSNLTEHEAAGKGSTDKLYISQDQGVKQIVESGDTHTVKCDGENKMKEDSCKGTAVPKCESADTVIESNVGLDRISSAANEVDVLEVIPSVMLPVGEDHEIWNMVENKKDEGTNTDIDIVNETSNASFATTLNEAFFQKEENEAPESDLRDNLIKEITEENNDIEASEEEGKEHIAEVDDPAITKCENRLEPPLEKKTEDEKSLNSDDTSKDSEQLDISRLMGIGTLPNKDDHQKEATELLMMPNKVAQSKVDTENFQAFITASDTEINEEKVEGATIEKGETILIEKSNKIEEILSNDHSVEKIGNKHRSTEDSSCCSPREEINQKSSQEDDLKPEVDPGVKADGTFVATNNTSSITKSEEFETPNTAESFKKEMVTEEKFVEGPSQVSAADETAKCGAEKGIEKRNVNDTTTYNEFKQEVDPEVKADETTNSASQSTKTEEPETNYTTQSFQNQNSDEERVAEGPHQTAEEIPNDQPPEEKNDRNFIDTKKKDELKPEPHTGPSADEVSETINDASNSKKFEEDETIETTQSFNNNLLSNDKVGEGSWQITEQLENYIIPAEEGKEERNVKDKTAADEIKLEIHTGEKVEEPEAVEATQKLNSPMPSGDHVVEVPFQASTTEDVVNYSAAEEGKEERKVADTAADDLKPEADPEVKVDELSATTSNTSQNIKFEGTEIIDAAQSFRKHSPTKDKGVEGPSQVSTAEEIANYCPTEEAQEERNAKDTAILEELNPELAPAIKEDEISETIKNASFQEPELNDPSQSVNKQIPSEDKVVEQPDEVSTVEEIVKYKFTEDKEEEEEKNVKDITTVDELQPKVDPGGRAADISETTPFAIESTKEYQFEDLKTVDATQSFNKQTTREDKVVEKPHQVSTADEAVNYGSVEEERKQGSIKDAILGYDLNPDVDREEKINKVSKSTENASETTKFEEPHCIDVSENFKKDIPSEDKIVEGHPRVSTEEIVNYSSAQEGKTTTENELKPEVDPKVEVYETSETTKTASETAKLEVPEILEATHGITTHVPSEDKVVEGTPEVSIAEDVGNYMPTEERKKDRKVNNATEDELPTTTKLEETNGTDVTQSFEKDTSHKHNVVEEPCQVSAAEEPVNDNSTEEGEKRNIIDATIQDELKPEVAPGIVSYSPAKEGQAESNVKETTTRDELKREVDPKVELEVPEIVEATHGITDQVVEGTPEVSIAEDVGNSTPAEERKEERKVNNATGDELPTTTKLEETNETNVTQSFEEKIPQKGNIVEEPCQVLAAEEPTDDNSTEEGEKRNVIDAAIQDELKPDVAPGIVNYSPAKEEKAESNVKETTTREELKREVDPKVELEVPEIIEATHGITTHMPIEFEGTPEFSIAEDIGNYRPTEERKEDKKFNNATGDELPTRTKLEETNGTDVTQSFEKETSQEGNAVDEPCQVSAAEEPANDNSTEEGEERNVIDAAIREELKPKVASGIVSYSPAKEGKAESNIKETTRDELKREIDPKVELEVHEIVEATHGITTHLPSEDKVVEGSPEVSIAEDVGNYMPAEARKEDRKVNNATEEELPTTTKLEETNGTDVTQSFNKEIPQICNIIEEPCHVSAAEEPVTDNSTGGGEKGNVIDAAIQDELNPEVSPGIMLEEISKNMKNASESTKFHEPEPIAATQSVNKEIKSEDKVVEGSDHVLTADEIVNYHVEGEGEFKEPKAVDATTSFQEEKPKEGQIEGHPKVSTAEEIVKYSPAEEEKDERNVKDTIISNEVNPEVDPGKISPNINNASQITKFEGTEVIGVTPSSNKEMPSEDMAVEGPSQVSSPEGMVSYIPEEEEEKEEGEGEGEGEGKAERNARETSTRDELKMEADPEIEGDDIFETKNSSTETTEFELNENKDATKDVNIQMPSEDKIAKGSTHVSIAEYVGSCSLEEERKDKNVNDATGYESPTRIKLEGSQVTDVTQSFEKDIPKQPFLVSAAEELVNDSPTEEEKEERNAIDASSQDEFQPEAAPGPKLEEISMTMKNFQEPELIDAIQSVKEQITSEDKVVEGPHHVSTEEEIISYHLPDEGDEKNVKDMIIMDDLKLKAKSGVRTEETYETRYASESTKFKEAETVDATRRFQKQMPKEDEFVRGPPIVSTTEQIVNCSPAGEEKEERNAKDTTSDDLKPDVDPGANINKLSETIDIATESTKIKEPEKIEVTQCFNNEVPMEDKVVEGPPQVSTAEEIVNYCHAEEAKTERNVNETATREPNMEVNPKVEVDEISKTTKSASETMKFEVPGTTEATQGINIQMPSEVKVIEGPFKVPIAEDFGNFMEEEERKEDIDVQNTTADKLPTEIKLEETDEADVSHVTHCFKKQIASKDLVVERPCQVSTAEELVNFIPAEEEKEENSVMNVSIQDEIKSEVAPEIQPQEKLENLKNASESKEIQEPETIDATQSSSKQVTYEDRDIEGPQQVSTAEGIDYYSLAQGEERNVNDSRMLDELKPEENPEVRADPLSETTYYASRSTKFEEPDTADANQSFNKQMPSENEVVEGPPQVSTAEEMVDYGPAEKREEEPNIKDTTISNDLKPEVDPGLMPNNISNIINSASPNTKLEDDEIVYVTQHCSKQMPSGDEEFEGPPQVAISEEIQNYSPAQEGKEESSVKDTSDKDDLETEVYPTVKFEEPKTIDATQSSKKKISSEYNVVGGSFEVSIAKEITQYSIEEGEETNVKDTTTADELKTEENTREKFDETETTDATQRFKKQMPRDVEGYHQGSTAVEIVTYSPANEEKEESNVKDATTKLELQEQAAKLPGRNTETEVTTSDEKAEIPEVGFPKYDEGVKGCNDQQNIRRNDLEVTTRDLSEKLGEHIVSVAETLKPVDEKIEDCSKSEDIAKDDTNAIESHKDDELTQYSASKSVDGITNTPGGLNLEKQEGSVGKVVILRPSRTSGDEEINKLDKEEQNLLTTEKESSKDVSSTALGSRFKDKQKEEKVEEQENHSTRTSVMKLDGDENLSKKIENEDKIFHNQNQNSDLPITGQESGREIQVEIKELHHGKDSIVFASEAGGESGEERKTSNECEGTSSSIKADLIPEVKVKERPTEKISAKAECSEDKGQVDTSIKEIAQKDELADLIQVTNNSENINMPCKSSIAMSDLEIMAKEDPETDSESQILSARKKISQVQEGLRGETLQPETEELKPGDASQAVAEAVRTEYGEKEQLNDDCNIQTENLGSAVLEENSPSELEQSSQKTPQEQEDEEAQDQQKNINDSRVEIARNEGPLDASSQMDTNLPLDMQKLELAPCCEFDKQVEEADPNDSSTDTKDLPEVQQKAIAESFSAGGENQEPVKCNEDKETEEATGKSILEEKSTTSPPELLEVPRNEISQVPGDFNSESKQTIQREEMKDGKMRTCELEMPNTDEDRDEEGEGNKQQRAESGYDHPVLVETSRDINVKASPKKSHNILSGVGSKVKHSISKVKKAITGKSSHPKTSSPK